MRLERHLLGAAFGPQLFLQRIIEGRCMQGAYLAEHRARPGRGRDDRAAPPARDRARPGRRAVTKAAGGSQVQGSGLGEQGRVASGLVIVDKPPGCS